MLPLIVAGAMLGKSLLIDGPQRKRERKLQSEMTRYSPWTGQTGQAPTTKYDPLGSAMQGGLAGLQMNSAWNKMGAGKGLADAGGKVASSSVTANYNPVSAPIAPSSASPWRLNSAPSPVSSAAPTQSQNMKTFLGSSPLAGYMGY